MNHAFLIIMNNCAIITNRLSCAVYFPRGARKFIRACDYSVLARGRGGARAATNVPKLKFLQA